MTHVAVIDHGKSNTRVVVFDQTVTQVAERSRPTPTNTSGPYPSEDVDTLLGFVIDALTEFAKEFEIEAIITVAHGAAGALIDDNGLVLPLVDYEYTPSAEINAAYDRLRPAYEETASPHLSRGLNLGRQLYMQHAEFPEIAARARAFVPLAQYWAFVLSGVMATEVTSLGAHTDLWDMRGGAPSSLVISQGWWSLFPPIRRAGDTLGTVRPNIARATGLSPTTRVLTGLHDSNASLVPYLSGETAPITVVSSGTWVIVMNVGGSIDCLDPDADMLANIDIFGRPTPSARFMGGREYAAIAGDDTAPSLESAQAVLDAGVLALPGFCDQGGPWTDVEGEVVGDVPDMPGARSALASLYSALVTDNLLDRLGVDGSVYVDGPLAQNTVWVSAMAGLRDAGVRPSDGASPAAGAAMLALGRTAEPIPSMSTPAKLDLTQYRERWNAAIAERG